MEGEMSRILYAIRAAFIGQALLAVLHANPVGGRVLVFPNIEELSDHDDILEKYPQYLRFVLAVGHSVDSQSADRLKKNFERLTKYDPDGAIRFLKGLRFEMMHKMELMGASPRTVTVNNSEIRRWVRRFLPDWGREADEHLFRAIALRAAERNRSRAE